MKLILKRVNIRMKIRLNFGDFMVKKVWKYKNFLGQIFRIQFSYAGPTIPTKLMAMV